MLTSVFALLLSGTVLADPFSGMAERVSDGDTMRVRSADGTRVTIRLAGIDAPEKSQPFGRAASRRLAALCLGKAVDADFRKRDRYGRTVARLSCEGTDPSRELLSEGLAWHYQKYAGEQPRDERDGDSSAERLARTERKGLWSDHSPVPPWEHRRAIKGRP